MKIRFFLPLLILVALPIISHADLLVLASDPVVWRFDDSSGALLGKFGGGGAERLEGETIGPDGNIYITGNTLGYGDVYRFDRYGDYLGKFNAGSTNGNLTLPGKLAFGPDGNCYVIGDTNILCFNGTNGLFLDTFITNADANDLAFGNDGNLYVADDNRGIVRYDGSTGAYLDTFVPLGADTIPDVKHFVFGPDENLYVCTWTSNAVFRFDGNTGQFMDAFVTPGSGGLNQPNGLTFGADSNLYVLSYSYTSDASGAILQYDGQTGNFLSVFATNSSAFGPPEDRALFTPHDLIFSPSFAGQTNRWTNSVSGNWEDSYWSLGVPPGPGQTIMLTNAGWKALAINANTAQNFPHTLSVDSIIISSPTNSFNTLLLNYAGLQTPLSANSLTVGSDSAVVMDSSALVITDSISINGNFSESYSRLVTGLLNVGDAGPAEFDMTNSMISILFTPFSGGEYVGGATFNQHGGTNDADVLTLEGGGEYDLFDGYVSGQMVFEGGNFNQWNGNVSAGFVFDTGSYHLAGGFLSSGDMQLPTVSPHSSDQINILQTGGTNFAGSITITSGSYTLSDGRLTSSFLSIYPFDLFSGGVSGNAFYQSGGIYTNGGITIAGAYDRGFIVERSSYNLSGGILLTPSISLDMGVFNQSDGTNQAIKLTLGDISSYNLSGGWLLAETIQITGGNFYGQTAIFQESGGTNESGSFSLNSCDYDLSGGQLNVSNFEISSGAALRHSAGEVMIPGIITLADGTWDERTGGEKLGQLEIGGDTNSILMPSSNSCILNFANSSGMNWPANSILQIENWSGSLYGGGSQQIIFGSTAAALTAQQVSQIRFHDPAGLSADAYPARILSDGEIVPDSGAPLPLAVHLATFTNRLPQLQLMGDIGNSYAIQASTNLINWGDVLTLTNTSGTISFIDDKAMNYPQRFYRAELK